MFKVKAGAPVDSLVMAANGYIGMGTATPGKGLHIKKTSFPGIRIQDSTQATWHWRENCSCSR